MSPASSPIQVIPSSRAQAFRNIVLIASFDFYESLRSRRALALLLLYVIGSVGATSIFVAVLSKFEEASSVRTPMTELLGMVAKLVGNPDIAKEIVTIPIVSLFYGWIALSFIPLIVVLTSSEVIASEVASGSVRFALFRCERWHWVCGKYLGQAILSLLGILAGGTGAYLIGLFFFSGFPPLDGGIWILRLSARAFCYGLPYLGLALGASQLTRSNSSARGLGLLAAFLLAVLGTTLQPDKLGHFFPALTRMLGPLFPQHYWLDLWRPQISARAIAILALIIFSLLYFAAGYFGSFRRRDQ